MKDTYTWSYSSIGLFQQCPHKYYRKYIKQDIKEPPTDAIRYGLMMHKAAEEYIRDDVELPGSLEYLQPALDKLKSYPGTQYCEHKMGLTRNLAPCAFDAQDVWWRGIADLLVVNGNQARIVDYKTGKSAKFADTKQLELLSMAVFKHFPEVEYVKAALLFVVSRDLVKATYSVKNTDEYWQRWLAETALLEKAFDAGTWNPRPNFTCRGWCAVTDCHHWTPRKS